MLFFRARGQRGITLIEIILVLAIVSAATLAIFVFSKKASVTASVETEQRQIENIVKTVDGLFATQPNFSALGTNGAEYLKARAARSGLKFGTDVAGEPALLTGLGGGTGTVTLSVRTVALPTGLSAPNNAYRLAYNGLTADECISLVTASYPVAYSISVSQDVDDVAGARLAERGQLSVSPDQIAENCAGSASPSAFLYFVPARAIAGAPTPTPPPAARCNPVHETQQAACPAGQVGTVTQERDGACTGPGNSIVYTVWSTTYNTCQAAVTAPPTVTPTPPSDNCALATYTQSLACPFGQTGQIVQQREHDTCAGTYTPWTTTSNSCQPAGPAATCTPSTATQDLACPAGQGGQITQTRSSTCASPTAVPAWSGWTTVSNTCTASCVAAGTCCTVRRQTQTTADPCPAGTYGNSGQDQERFLGCVNASTQSASWTPWQTMTSTGSCTACPANTTETGTRWEPRTGTCPTGQTGTLTYDAEQVQTRTKSYSCPAGTAALPAPTYSAWSGWMDTGAQQNVINTCTTPPSSCVSAPSVPAWNTPGGPQLKMLIACVANWNNNFPSGPTSRPNFAAIKAATPPGGTRVAAYEADSTSGGWQCVSTNQWMSPTVSGSANTGFGVKSYVYAEVEWNGTTYTGWAGEETLNFDECHLKGNGIREGDCWLGINGAMPEGLALMNAVNTPSSVHAAFLTYACP